MSERPTTIRLLRGDGDHQVTPMELFFDLVFVFAITQLSHLLLDHLDVHGVLQTTLLLLAVWWAWMYTNWTTNWFDPNQRPVRIVLVGVMAASLVMSAVLGGTPPSHRSEADDGDVDAHGVTHGFTHWASCFHWS